MIARDYLDKVINENCPKCGVKVHLAIKKIEDGEIVIYKDGSLEY